MQKKILIPAGIILFAVSLFLMFKPKSAQIISLRDVKDHGVVDGEFLGSDLSIEIVNTPQSIGSGLSGKDSLETDGMLFVFDSPKQPSFWMKNMKFSIDLYWIKDGVIIGAEKNLTPPEDGTQDGEIEVYTSPGFVDMVLEIPVEKGISLEF